MKTEDLIAALEQKAAPAPAAMLERRTGLGLLLGGVIAVALFFLLLDPRPGLGAALSEPLILAKTLLPLALGALALPLMLRSARPAVSPGGWLWLLLLVPMIAAALLVWAFLTAEPGTRLTLMLGNSIPVCLPSITLLSLPMLAGLLVALKRGAPLRPALCGALAGLVAAGLATSLYSLRCVEDTPLFYSVWYSLAIAAMAGLGAGMGARYLRW